MEQLDLFGSGQCLEGNKDFVKVQVDVEQSQYTKEISKVFSAFSNIATTPAFAQCYEYDNDVKSIIDLIEIGAKKKLQWRYVDVPKRQITVPTTSDIVVCFSGGKDSTATAIKMKEGGWNVHLFYVKGINKSYPDEFVRAQKIAQYLEMPLHVVEVRQTGKTTFYDNPVKNQLIASMALDYAIKHSIGIDIAFGDFTTDNIGNSCFNEDWSDSQEMWEAYIQYIRKFIPNANIHIPFQTYLETMDIVSKDEDLLNMVQGCVLPHRFRATRKRENEKKYNITLLANRCGSCWKCCMEYIYYAEKSVVAYNKEFYKHCLDILVKKTKDLKPNVNDKSIEDVYKAFLYKDFTKTNYYKDIYGTK